jgi:DNA polymerase-3 subunit alpha
MPTEEWDQGQLLTFEKEALGFFITGHPLARYEEQLKLYGDCNTQSVLEVPDGQKVSLGGMVSNAKLTTTRKGDRMAFVTLEDLHGSLEVIVFPKVLEEVSGQLTGEEPVLVTGRVDSGEEGAKLIAETIKPLTGGNNVSKVHIKLVPLAMDPDLLEGMKRVLEKHRGQCPVLLHLDFPGKGEVAIAASENFAVSPDEDLLKEVEEAVGQGSVYLE